jgi:hypothetical protein
LSAPSAGFFARLVTILSLRANLYYRRQAARGWTGRLSSLLMPMVGAALLVSLWGFVGEVAPVFSHTELVALGAAAVALVHFLVLMEVVALVGRGEGMASALHHFPLSPALIHSSEMIASAVTPATLFSLTALLSGARFLGGVPLASFAWGLLGVVYILGLRRMLQLALANVLRRRFLREAALAAVSTVGLGVYLAFSWFARDLHSLRLGEWLENAPVAFWMLPTHWFVVPFSGMDLPLEARVVALVGAPLLVVAVLVIGFDLQDRAVFGETSALLRARGGRRAGPSLHLPDRFPFSLVPAVLWATASKELRVIRRDPFLMVMLVTQTVVLLALPFLMLERGPRGGGGAYLPLFALLLVMGQSRPAFNSLGTEGRALRFLAQTPASRWHVLLGKSLAYGLVFSVTNAFSLMLACWLFGGLSSFPLYLGLSMASLVVLLGMGNLVSVWAPIPWIGARAAAGGARSAAASAEGGVERPGCGALLIRMLLLQTVPLLVLPVFGVILLAQLFLSASWAMPLWLAAGAWCVAIYAVTTWLAVQRLARAEERILALLAGRGAA